MKHTEFLKKLSNEEFIKMINEYSDFHEKTGILPEKSLLRKFTELVCEDYQSPFNLSIGEKIFLDEVIRRYKLYYGDISM